MVCMLQMAGFGSYMRRQHEHCPASSKHTHLTSPVSHVNALQVTKTIEFSTRHLSVRWNNKLMTLQVTIQPSHDSSTNTTQV